VIVCMYEKLRYTYRNFRFSVYMCAFCTHEKSLTFRGNLNYTDLSKMDQLPTDQQEALRKTNTERLRIMAAKTYNVGDDELETMDRTVLLKVVARDIVSRTGATSRGGQKNQIK